MRLTGSLPIHKRKINRKKPFISQCLKVSEIRGSFWQGGLAMNDDAPRPIEELLKEEYGFEADKEKSTKQGIYNTDLPTRKLELNLVSYKELRSKIFPPNKWLVQNLIPDNGITCISGEPKVGKSFITLDLIISIAKGEKFLGEFQTEKKRILLISKEDGERLIQDRCKTLDSEEDRPIFFCTDQSVFLDNGTYTNLLIEKIREQKIDVLVLDSFRRMFKGDENSSQIISEVQNHLQVLLKEGISIIFIHHHGKEGILKRKFAQKLRGSSDILAMLDSLLIAERKDAETLKITQEALRIAKPISPFIIRFPSFENGDNEFEFKGYVEEEKEKRDEAKEAILAYLETTPEANQKTIIDNIRSEDKSLASTTIKETLQELVDTKQITSKKEGRFRFYSSNQESIEDAQVVEAQQIFET